MYFNVRCFSKIYLYVFMYLLVIFEMEFSDMFWIMNLIALDIITAEIINLFKFFSYVLYDYFNFSLDHYVYWNSVIRSFQLIFVCIDLCKLRFINFIKFWDVLYKVDRHCQRFLKLDYMETENWRWKVIIFY